MFGLRCQKTAKPVPLKNIDVHVDIVGYVSNVRSSLEYQNEEDSPMEAVFVFPLDETSAVYKFEAVIEGRRVVGKVKEKQKAREEYDDAIASGEGAFLLEEDDRAGDVFRCSVGNLPPKTSATIHLSYVVELPVEADSSVKFVLPTVLNPRYSSGAASAVYDDTDMAPAGAVMTSDLPYHLKLTVDVSSPNSIDKIESPSASIDVTYSGTSAKIPSDDVSAAIASILGDPKLRTYIFFYSTAFTIFMAMLCLFILWSDFVTTLFKYAPQLSLPVIMLIALVCSAVVVAMLFYLIHWKMKKVTLKDDHKSDSDVELFVHYKDKHRPFAVTEQGQGTDGFMADHTAMLTFLPDLSREDLVANCGEFIFILDRSGSMSGSKIKNARETLLLFLKSLPVGCYFNIVGFGSQHESLFKSSQQYDNKSLKKACKALQKMEADLGGTEILQPLQYVYKQPAIAGHPRQLFLLTDGEVWDTQACVSEVAKHADSARCFSVGIGEGASTALVKGVARAGRGKAEFVSGTERLQAKVMRLLSCALQPTVTNVSLTWQLPDGVTAMSIPSTPPPIFSGDRFIMYAQLQGQIPVDATEGSVTLCGQMNDEEIKHSLSLTLKPRDQEMPSVEDSSEPPLHIHRLAAKTLVKELEVNMEKDGDNDESATDVGKKQIIDISVAANVVSKFTSFIGIDSERDEPIQGAMVRRNIYPSYRMAPRLCGGGPPPGVMMCAMSAPPPQVKCYALAANSFDECDFGGALDVELDVYDDCEDLACESMAWEAAPASSHVVEKEKESLASRLGGTVKGLFSGFRLRGGGPGPGGARANSGPSFKGAVKKGKSKVKGRMMKKKAASVPKAARALKGGGRHESSEEEEDSPPPSTVIPLQLAEGSWELDGDLAAVLGVKLDRLKKECPVQKKEVWATVLALVWLHTKMADKKVEWQMLARKATAWLKANQQGWSADDVVGKACGVMGSKVDPAVVIS